MAALANQLFEVKLVLGRIYCQNTKSVPEVLILSAQTPLGSHKRKILAPIEHVAAAILPYSSPEGGKPSGMSWGQNDAAKLPILLSRVKLTIWRDWSTRCLNYTHKSEICIPDVRERDFQISICIWLEFCPWNLSTIGVRWRPYFVVVYNIRHCDESQSDA